MLEYPAQKKGKGYDGRPILVAETPVALLCRRKGTRLTLSIPWSMAYLRGATLAAQSLALAKANKKRRKEPQGVSRGAIRF